MFRVAAVLVSMLTATSGCSAALDPAWTKRKVMEAVLAAEVARMGDDEPSCLHRILVGSWPAVPLPYWATHPSSRFYLLRSEPSDTRFPDGLSLPSPLFFCDPGRPSSALTMAEPEVVGAHATVPLSHRVAPSHEGSTSELYDLRREQGRWRVIGRQVLVIGM